jgi:hypothetical protein
VANLASNPWSLLPADPAIAAIGVGTVTLNADGTVTVASAAALTFNASASTSNAFTLTGITNALYNGFYERISGASGQGTFVLAPQFSIPSGTAASTSGTIAQCLYPWQVRVEDISWQNVGAAGDTLDLRDRMGNIVWQAKGAGAGQQNRGKIYWINGLTPITITSGIVLLTIN